MSDEAPTTILDLGSGPGGFPIAVARSAGDRALRIVATDVRPEYLAMGAEQAHAAGVSGTVEFRRLDAFRLVPDLGDWRPDVITCMRTLHHFGVRRTTRLLALALHTARRGILFVDIARSVSRLLMAAGAGVMSGNRRFAHDAVISVRKAFTPAELRLMAACVPGGDALEISYHAPAYLVARGAATGGTGAASR
jgi:2-polyprenyl-3-methyl-5-hydroxy-6-metoxy-1,4-benzoquinol methylase